MKKQESLSFWQTIFGKSNKSKRVDERHKAMRDVYIKVNNRRQLIGYLTDISKGGARIFIHNYEKFFKNNIKLFHVLILADNTDDVPVQLPVELSWFKVWNKDDNLFEVGLKFSKNISRDEKNYLGLLIKNFTG